MASSSADGGEGGGAEGRFAHLLQPIRCVVGVLPTGRWQRRV